MNALIEKARKQYHRNIIERGILTIDAKGIPSNADKSSRLSKEIALKIASALMAEEHENVKGRHQALNSRQ